TAATLGGVIGSDVVTINHSGYTASFATKTVGTAKPVTVTGVALSGADAANYTVSQPSGLTADITAVNLTVNGAVANSRPYDAPSTAPVSSTAATLGGVIGSDVVTLNHS